MRKIHLMNEASRDATVAIDNVRAKAKPALGLPGKALSFRRYVAATEDKLDAAMVAAHGEGYAQALIDGDAAEGLRVINAAVDSGSDPRQFGQQVVDHLRALLITQTAGAEIGDPRPNLLPLAMPAGG